MAPVMKNKLKLLNVPGICKSALIFVVMAGCLAVGCKTNKSTGWEGRAGVSTYVDAITELGQPVRSVELSDGSLVAQWLYRKAEDRMAHKILYGSGVSDLKDEPRMSDKYLNLTFGPDRVLRSSRWSSK